MIYFETMTLAYLLGGVLAGTFAGLLPGIGNTLIMILAFPFFLGIDNPLNIIIFYVACLSLSQYTGSITSTVFSVPGEISSLPAVKEGHKLFRKGLGSLSLSGCALGSFFGSLIAVAFVLLIGNTISQFTFLYSSVFQSYVLIIVCLFLIVGKYNNWYTTVLLGAFGYFLAMLGTGALDTYKTITFGFDSLLYGVPLFSVIVWMFVFPQILQYWDTKMDVDNDAKSIDINPFKHIRSFLGNITSSIRGSVIGFFLGLTPYLTTVISSNVSYAVEKWLRKKKNTYDDTGDYASLVSAETANNAAALSSLLPLLLIGIPITSSEAVLLELTSANGFTFYVEEFYGLFVLISICLVVINLLGIFIAWPLAKYFYIFYYVDIKTIYRFVLGFCVLMTLYLGYADHVLWYYIVISSILAVFGYLLRRVNTLPLIFVFMMQDGLEENITRLLFYL